MGAASLCIEKAKRNEKRYSMGSLGNSELSVCTDREQRIIPKGKKSPADEYNTDVIYRHQTP